MGKRSRSESRRPPQKTTPASASPAAAETSAASSSHDSPASAITPSAPKRPTRLIWLIAVLIAIAAAAGWWRGRHYGVGAARAAMERGEPVTAVAWLDWSDRYFGNSPESLLQRARIERKMGSVAAAEMNLQAAAGLGADMNSLLREQILLQAQISKLDSPAKYLEQLLADSPQDASEIYEAFARGLLMSGNLEETHRLVNQWSERCPTDPLPHYFLGVMRRDVSWSGDAAREFREALRRDPRHAESSLELAILSMRAHHYEESIPLYETALAKAPDDSRARVGLAHSLRMLGDTKAARQTLEPILDASRPDVGVLAELGRIELMEGRYEQALRHFEAARALMPRNAEINYAYASTLAALQRHGEAQNPFEFAIEGRRSTRKIAELSELLKARPDDLGLRCEIAQLAFRFGDPRAALGWAQSALERNPDFEPAKQIVEQVRALMR